MANGYMKIIIIAHSKEQIACAFVDTPATTSQLSPLDDSRAPNAVKAMCTWITETDGCEHHPNIAFITSAVIFLFVCFFIFFVVRGECTIVMQWDSSVKEVSRCALSSFASARRTG